MRAKCRIYSFGLTRLWERRRLAREISSFEIFAAQTSCAVVTPNERFSLLTNRSEHVASSSASDSDFREDPVSRSKACFLILADGFRKTGARVLSKGERSIRCHVSTGSTGVRAGWLLLLEQFRPGAERGHQVQRERNRKPRVPRPRVPFAARVRDRRRTQGRLQCPPQSRVSSRGDDRFQDMFPLDFRATSVGAILLYGTTTFFHPRELTLLEHFGIAPPFIKSDERES